MDTVFYWVEELRPGHNPGPAERSFAQLQFRVGKVKNSNPEL